MTATEFALHIAWSTGVVLGTLLVAVASFHLLQPYLFGRGALKVSCGRSHCWIPASLATLIVETIDEDAFREYRRGSFGVQLDGRALHALAERGIGGLTLVQRWSLYRVGQVALVSYLLPPWYDEVSIDRCSIALTLRARRRGRIVDSSVRIYLAARAQQRLASTGG